MNFLVQSLDDVYDHSVAVDGWNQSYRQMTPGAFRSRLAQASAPGFQYFHEATNRRTIQQGVSPSDSISLAIPLRAPIKATFQGQMVDGYAFLILGAHEEFRFHTQEVMDFIGISLPLGEMSDLVDAVAGSVGLRRLHSGVLPVPIECGTAMQDTIAPFLDQAELTPSLWAHTGTAKVFRDELVSALLDQFAGAVADSPNDLTHRTYSDIVRRCEAIVHQSSGDPITVLDLCHALRCSRRTLQTSFQRVANVTPVAYLRAYRLNGVREFLRSTSPDKYSIGDAANHFGFGHLGYFAQEYRALFNEMPSRTRRKT